MEPSLLSVDLNLEFIIGSAETEICYVMEGYNEIENDVYNAFNDVTTGTAKGRKHEERHHNMQIVCHIEEKDDVERNQLIDIGVFKLTSGNARKQLRMRQKMRETISTNKITEATLKQIATQDF